MTDEERTNILKKIRKLLNLKESAEKIGSKGEAYAAAQGVHRLLLKYNLSMSEVMDNDNTVNINIDQKEGISYKDKYGNWKSDLLMVICHYNFCTELVQPRIHRMSIVGEEHNVVVVAQLYDYLVTAFKKLVNDNYEKWLNQINENMGTHIPLSVLKQTFKGKDTTVFYRSFFNGAVYGLQEQYKSMQQTTEETSLVVTHKQAIEDFLSTLDNYTGETFKGRNRKNDFNVYAYNQGETEGRKISLNKQIKEEVHFTLESI